MPIQESYREGALSKVREMGGVLIQKVKELLKDVDPEDIDFGLKLQAEWYELEDLWRERVEENNYMEVAHTEIMEHHDGAYLKVTFRNSVGEYWEERYVSIWSSGRVELSHAFFISFEGIKIRVEKVGEGMFHLFIKAQ